MIVPRSFASHRVPLDEKSACLTSQSRSRNSTRSNSPSYSPSSSPPRSSIFSSETRSSPVRIPSRGGYEGSNVSTPRSSAPPPTEQSAYTLVSGFKRGSAQAILTSTTIPSRRRNRGRPSQRLPNCDYVADFSRLLWDDVKIGENGLSRSGGSSYVDGLFGNIDGLMEGQMIVGSEGVDESILTTRSISSDSLASLASPDDYSCSGMESHKSSLGRSFEIKRMRQLTNSATCVKYHPLLETEAEEDIVNTSTPKLSPVKTTTPLMTEKKARSFKSSLTASLKALKSAAQSVSSKANLFVAQESNSHLARSFFDIQPYLTDDKRPPPGTSPPSAQLRRYLNPYSSNVPADSPAQLHFWQDDRDVHSSKQGKKSKTKPSRRRSVRNGVLSPPTTDDLPGVVPLATCLPPSIRTANASSPPIWLNPDGTPSNKVTASLLPQTPEALLEPSTTPIIRHREPRENRDFLRIFVCEMAMRRNGKLSDDLSTGRAKPWLPPVGNNFKGQILGNSEVGTGIYESPKQGANRWSSWTIDEF